MDREFSLSGGVLERQLLALPDEGPHSWRQVLERELLSDLPRYTRLDQTLTREYAQGAVNPAPDNLFRAFRECPFDSTVLVLCGQDPYPNACHAMGLSFSVPAGVTLPPSLRNILRELESDVGSDIQVHDGDLTPWAQQGVLLLNTALTVQEGASNSHKALWDGFALRVLSALNREREKPLAFLLWGRQARDMGAVMERTAPPGCPRAFVYGVHPSPLSAYRGFFGSRPFTEINRFLQAHGERPIRW